MQTRVVDSLEVILEDFARDQVERFVVKPAVTKRMDCEDVAQLCLGFQSDVNVVAKVKPLAERGHILGDTVVVHRAPLGGANDSALVVTEAKHTAPHRVKLGGGG